MGERGWTSAEAAAAALEGVERVGSEVERLRGELCRQERLSSLGLLAAMAAHEINNLLTPVAAQAELALVRERPEGLSRRGLERAVEGAHQASELCRRLLDLASGQVEAGESWGGATVGEAVGRALGFLPSSARARVEVRLEEAGEEPVGIDALALQQVALNLLLNAVAAAGRGGRVWVGAEMIAGGVRLEVADDGPGLGGVEGEVLFQPFRRGEGGGREGVGLGLAVCHRLVSEAGGRIYACEREGGGARLVVELARGAGESARAA